MPDTHYANSNAAENGGAQAAILSLVLRVGLLVKVTVKQELEVVGRVCS